MKRWIWWIYLGLVHLALAWLIIIPGRVYLKNLSMPIKFAWLKPAAVPGLGLTKLDAATTLGATKIGVVMHENETIASFIFEENALDTTIFRWPSMPQEYSLGRHGLSINLSGGVLATTSPPEVSRFFIDRDGDGLPDVEARSSSDFRAMLRSEWVMEWRVNRATRAYEFYNRTGDAVARATPDDAADTTFWRLERLNGEQVTGSEVIADNDFSLSALVEEFNPGG